MKRDENEMKYIKLFNKLSWVHLSGFLSGGLATLIYNFNYGKFLTVGLIWIAWYISFIITFSIILILNNKRRR